MEQEAQLIYSLCPNCEACPTLEVFGDRVRIGEGDNLVTLTREQWNRMVAAIRRGELKELDCGCGCGCQ